GGFRACRIEWNCAAGKPRRTQITEQEARIGERGLGASEAVTGGTRMGPRTFRTDLERAAAIEPHDAAAARADLRDVDGGRAQRVAAAFGEPPRAGEFAPDLVLARIRDLAVLDQARFRRG